MNKDGAGSSFEFCLKPGDIVICSSRFGSPCLFSNGNQFEIFGTLICQADRSDFGLIIEAFPPSTPNHRRIYEHVVKILTPTGLGFAWRGFMTKFCLE